MKYENISKKIIQLKEKDLSFREDLISKNKLEGGYNEEMARIHIENANVLNDIIDQIGYPTTEKVGKEGSDAAWLIIQHAISLPKFMKKCAALLEIEVNSKHANPISLAYLKDRIAVFEGFHQTYGTQYDWDENGEMSPNNIGDIAQVNRRRKSIGLNSVEEQTQIMRDRVKQENQTPPPDLDLRRKEYNLWRLSVGWIDIPVD